MKLHSALVAALGATVVLTACAGPGVPSAPASTPAAGPLTPSTSASAPTSAATASSSPASPSQTSASPATPTLGATLGPAPTGSATIASSTQPMPTGAPASTLLTTTSGAPLVLGTGNAFHADGWKIQDAQAAGTTGKAPAMASVVNCDAAGSTLEYRFSNSTGSVDVEAAQDVLSVSATNTLSIALVADGKTVAEKHFGFKEPAALRAPLAGVTVLQVVVKPTGTCTASSTVLITKAIATG